MLLLYNLFVRIYFVALRIASLWNRKAAQWVEGRKSWHEELQAAVEPNDRFIWMHCSSAGEFEQGKPLIESLKRQYPDYKLLLTFFSPSGFAVANRYPHADALCYLPLDTRHNAERFVQTVQPQLAIFVKYEFWYHHLSVAANHRVPLLLVSAVFRPGQIFFRVYGRFFKNMLHFFQHVFVQDESSLRLLRSHGIRHATVSGDTRFDRVAAVAGNPTDVPFVDGFTLNRQTLVAGSTWPDDEALLADYLRQNKNVKCIVAPHEVNEKHVQSLRQLFPQSVLYTTIRPAVDNAFLQPAVGAETLAGAQVLIIDCVGLLSRLYQYAAIAYVGGGFTRDGIHNILEAAVWGKPVVFGPNYKKYREAADLIDVGGGYSVTTTEALQTLANDLFGNEQKRQAAGENAKNYVQKNTGATETVLRLIQEKRLLTRL